MAELSDLTDGLFELGIIADYEDNGRFYMKSQYGHEIQLGFIDFKTQLYALYSEILRKEGFNDVQIEELETLLETFNLK